MKKLPLVIGMLLWSFFGFAQVGEQQPITNLEAAVHENDTVLLTWDFPLNYDASSIVLSWIKADTINDMAQCGFDSYAGSLFDELDLRQFVGWGIESISFYKVSNWTHYICVFEQKQGEEILEIYNQLVPDELPFGLNTIVLEEDLEIEADSRYWVALRIKREESQTGYSYPFGFVLGDYGALGKSDLWKDVNSGWWSLSYYNYWIKCNLINEKERNCRLNVKDISSLTGYRVYRDGELVKEIPYSFVTYFKDTEYTRGVDVEYCVTALYGNEESDPVCVTAAITGVAETAGNDKIAISPNPTTGLVRIEGETVADAMVYNTLGQRVLSAHHTNEINLKDLPPGIYTLHVTTMSGSVLTKKIVKE